MKSTGLVRRIDELGRIVLPVELRRSMGIAQNDPIEILVDDGGQIIFRKYKPACVFCGSTTDVQHFQRKAVCRECSTAIFKNTKAM